MSALAIRPLAADDRARASAQLAASWGGTPMVTRGQIHDLDALPGFIAARVGVPITLRPTRSITRGANLSRRTACRRDAGWGVALGQPPARRQQTRRARRAAAASWSITTNDNTRALRFYQRRGFRLAALRRDAVATTRLLTPSLPLLGDDDIPVRDELALEPPFDGAG